MRLLALGASMLVALILAEVLVSVFVPITGLVYRHWDPVIGPRNRPGQEGRHIRGRLIDAPYHFNAQGWNHPDDYVVRKGEGTTRICVVGDSFVESMQVRHEETFFHLAEKRMRERGEDVQWYAFGNSGFGTARELEVIRHYVLEYRPDIVLMLFVSNDPDDCSPYWYWNRGMQSGRAHWIHYSLDEEGELVLHPARYWDSQQWKKVWQHSSLWRYFRVQTHLGSPGLVPGGGDSPAADFSGEPELIVGLSDEARQAKTWALVEALLRRCSGECARQGAVFLLAYYGSPQHIHAARVGVPYEAPAKEADPCCLWQRRSEMGSEMLGPIADRLGMPFLDLTGPLSEKSRALGQRHDIEGDSHYSAAGHAMVAEALVEWIDSLGAVPR